jgi:hypothetical protein
MPRREVRCQGIPESVRRPAGVARSSRLKAARSGTKKSIWKIAAAGPDTPPPASVKSSESDPPASSEAGKECGRKCQGIPESRKGKASEVDYFDASYPQVHEGAAKKPAAAKAKTSSSPARKPAYLPKSDRDDGVGHADGSM